MKVAWIRWVLTLVASSPAAAQSLDHRAWDAILKAHTTTGARVDYGALKQDPAALDGYLKQVAARWPAGLAKAERKAALLNTYNALTIRWIVTHYPVRSIWKTPQPFTGVRHTVDGKRVSLDGIETELRALGDPRVHSAVVCASLGCPPIRREAWVAERLDAQLDDQVKTWLSSVEYNRFEPARKAAHVSMIFQWYADDFKPAGVRAFLSRYVPGTEFLKSGEAKIDYLSYPWGLNDTASSGADYSENEFAADQRKNAH